MKIFWERKDIGNLTVGIDKNNSEIVYLVTNSYLATDNYLVTDSNLFNLDKINEVGDSERILYNINLDRLLLFFNTKQLKPIC